MAFVAQCAFRPTSEPKSNDISVLIWTVHPCEIPRKELDLWELRWSISRSFLRKWLYSFARPIVVVISFIYFVSTRFREFLVTIDFQKKKKFTGKCIGFFFSFEQRGRDRSLLVDSLQRVSWSITRSLGEGTLRWMMEKRQD